MDSYLRFGSVARGEVLNLGTNLGLLTTFPSLLDTEILAKGEVDQVLTGVNSINDPDNALNPRNLPHAERRAHIKAAKKSLGQQSTALLRLASIHEIPQRLEENTSLLNAAILGSITLGIRHLALITFTANSAFHKSPLPISKSINKEQQELNTGMHALMRDLLTTMHVDLDPLAPPNDAVREVRTVRDEYLIAVDELTALVIAEIANNGVLLPLSHDISKLNPRVIHQTPEGSLHQYKREEPSPERFRSAMIGICTIGYGVGITECIATILQDYRDIFFAHRMLG